MVIDNLLCTRSTTLSGIRNVVYPSLEPRLGALAFEYVGARCIPADHASLISLFFGQEGLCRAYTVTFCVPMDEGRERTDGGSCAYALLANVIVAGEGASVHDLPHFAGGIVPGDGIFTTWSYRAGAGRAEAFLLNPQPLTARTAHEWGVVAEVVANGKALSRARELAALYLKVPEVTRLNTRVHFIHPLKERIVREVKLNDASGRHSRKDFFPRDLRCSIRTSLRAASNALVGRSMHMLASE